MSLPHRLLRSRSNRRSVITNTPVLDDKPDFPLSPKPAAFDEPIFDKLDEMDTPGTMAPSPKRVHANDDVPALPPKSALRASRLLDNHGLALGGAVEAADLSQATTPHDVYLSSEEDASSDADDFSDYEYDSSIEDPASPTRRSSREDTARAVSVVFAGKPSLIDLPATRKRPTSSSSLGTSRTRSSTRTSIEPTPVTTATTEDRPATPASTASSHSRPKKDVTPSRKSVFLSEILVKKKPPFLSIDPYAHGSHYSLDIPKALDSLEHENQPARTPRTPTMLLKGVTRSLSLVRKRSRPALNSPQDPVPRIDTSVASHPSRFSVHSPAVVHADHPGQEKEEADRHSFHGHDHPQRPKTPLTPISYNDILNAVKRGATMMGAASPPSDSMSATSPGPAPTKKGILSGIAARRKSTKLTGKPLV
ncbi:hypothetical protein VTI74DRAFT_6161 [Chaetomium olivicolor]